MRSPTRRCSPTSLAGSQAQVLQPLVVLVQQHDLGDGDLLVSIGDDHELQREAQRYTGDPQAAEDPPTVPAAYAQPEPSAPTLSCPRRKAVHPHILRHTTAVHMLQMCG